MNYPAADSVRLRATGYQESVVRSQNPEEQQSLKVPILLFFILNSGSWLLDTKILLTRCFQLLYRNAACSGVLNPKKE